MLKTPELETDPAADLEGRETLKPWTASASTRLLSHRTWATPPESSDEFPAEKQEKTLENEAVFETAFRNEAATSGLGADENPSGKASREALTPWPRPVPQPVETKPCDKPSGRLKARSGIVIYDDSESIRGGR